MGFFVCMGQDGRLFLAVSYNPVTHTHNNLSSMFLGATMAKLNPAMTVLGGENGTFRAALTHPVTHEILRLSDRRLSYGEAWSESLELAEKWRNG